MPRSNRDDTSFVNARDTADIARWLFEPAAGVAFVASQIQDKWEAVDGGSIADAITAAYDACGPVDDWKNRDGTAALILSTKLAERLRKRDQAPAASESSEGSSG